MDKETGIWVVAKGTCTQSSDPAGNHFTGKTLFATPQWRFLQERSQEFSRVGGGVHCQSEGTYQIVMLFSPPVVVGLF